MNRTMHHAAQYSAGYAPGEKTHKDENFPVASYVIAKPYRQAVLAFYRFARAADDVADHPDLTEAQKIEQLDAFEATLLGHSDAVADALPLRSEIRSRNLSPVHAQDLLVAFRQDSRKQRYATWQELLDYCRYSAAPVGRFVLDVHGESPSSWPANDVLCSILQIINHLQDCGGDYTKINRIYLPQDRMRHYGVAESDLGAAQSSVALRHCLKECAQKTIDLLPQAALSSQVNNRRLRIEVTCIEQLSSRLLALLATRDPLSERVHLSKRQLVGVMLKAVLVNLLKTHP
ncbi:MAG: squalene synthase HpnC [Rickettsiales bacterium]|nr:squalene synthase HpnC [Rickettsiales bacterium]